MRFTGNSPERGRMAASAYFLPILQPEYHSSGMVCAYTEHFTEAWGRWHIQCFSFPSCYCDNTSQQEHLRKGPLWLTVPSPSCWGSQGRRNLTQLVASYPQSGSRGACLCSAPTLLPESRIPSQGTVTSKVGESSHLDQPKKW